MALSKFPLGGWIFGGQRKKNETPPPIPRIATELEVRELRYLFTSNFCTKFQPNQLIITLGPWNTFPNSDTKGEICSACFRNSQERIPSDIVVRFCG